MVSMKNNIEIVKLFLDYAKQNNIILAINEKNRKEESPLSLAIQINNKEMIILLFKYVRENNILIIDENYYYGTHSILMLSNDYYYNSGEEIYKSILEYAKENNIS